MSTSKRKTYHHGDLRTALLDAATELLEEGEQFSLRAVARKAEVSQTAPYRHFKDREALESALAVRGFEDLRKRFSFTGEPADSIEGLLQFAVSYIIFAMERPAIFKLMFGQECDEEDDDRVVAAENLRTLLAQSLAGLFPGVDHDALATSLWSLTHGLAFLHLDGKLEYNSPDDATASVMRTFGSLQQAFGAMSLEQKPD